MQKSGKMVARRPFAVTFMIAGAILLITSFITYWALDPAVFYDLYLYIALVGAAALGYGLNQLLGKRFRGTDVELSGKTAKRFITNNAIMIALLLLVVVIMIIQPRFMKLQVLLDILTQSSTKMIVALGICFTLLIAGTDLSAGRMVGLSAVISTSML